MGLEETSDGIRSRLKGQEGTIRLCEAAYIAGCDGAHSTVRQALGIGFSGGYLALVDAEARATALGSYLDRHGISLQESRSGGTALPRPRAAGESH